MIVRFGMDTRSSKREGENNQPPAKAKKHKYKSTNTGPIGDQTEIIEQLEALVEHKNARLLSYQHAIEAGEDHTELLEKCNGTQQRLVTALRRMVDGLNITIENLIFDVCKLELTVEDRELDVAHLEADVVKLKKTVEDLKKVIA